jgi:growth factor-regulated tyrosine kinase substrate
MREKLELMRQKKQEYLQYQRQVALQRMQEQEREMMLRHEQAKQHYILQQQQQHFNPAAMYGNPMMMQNPYQPYLPPGQFQQSVPTTSMHLPQVGLPHGKRLIRYH